MSLCREALAEEARFVDRASQREACGPLCAALPELRRLSQALERLTKLLADHLAGAFSRVFIVGPSADWAVHTTLLLVTQAMQVAFFPCNIQNVLSDKIDISIKHAALRELAVKLICPLFTRATGPLFVKKRISLRRTKRS